MTKLLLKNSFLETNKRNLNPLTSLCCNHECCVAIIILVVYIQIWALVQPIHNIYESFGNGQHQTILPRSRGKPFLTWYRTARAFYHLWGKCRSLTEILLIYLLLKLQRWLDCSEAVSMCTVTLSYTDTNTVWKPWALQAFLMWGGCWLLSRVGQGGVCVWWGVIAHSPLHLSCSLRGKKWDGGLAVVYVSTVVWEGQIEGGRNKLFEKCYNYSSAHGGNTLDNWTPTLPLISSSMTSSSVTPLSSTLRRDEPWFLAQAW